MLSYLCFLKMPFLVTRFHKLNILMFFDHFSFLVKHVFIVVFDFFFFSLKLEISVFLSLVLYDTG